MNTWRRGGHCAAQCPPLCPARAQSLGVGDDVTARCLLFSRSTYQHLLAPAHISQTMASPYLPSASSSKAAADAPVTRSRTLFYLSVRDSSSFSRPSARGGIGSVAQYGDTVDVDDDERGGLLGRAPSHRVDMEHGLPPKWYVEVVRAVRGGCDVCCNYRGPDQTGWTSTTRWRTFSSE